MSATPHFVSCSFEVVSLTHGRKNLDITSARRPASQSIHILNIHFTLNALYELGDRRLWRHIMSFDLDMRTVGVLATHKKV